MSFYVVVNGKKPGIYKTWKDCELQVKGFSGAVYKKFDNLDDAKNFFNSNSDSNSDSNESDEEKEINYYVYTDGACVNNGKKNAKAGYGIYFGENDKRNVSKRVDGKQTNNVAELTAIIETYKIIEKDIASKRIVIFTDSKYALKCIQLYGKKQDLNGWKEDIPNKDLVKKIYTLYKEKKNVEFRHIKAHTGKKDIHSIGNENADRLATESICIDEKEKEKRIKKEKIYLNVKYEDKETIKGMCGKWDRNKKKWYVYKDNKKIKEILEKFILD